VTDPIYRINSVLNSLDEVILSTNLLPEHNSLITILSDKEYMTNLWNRYCFIRESVARYV
jgi:hypothetical protein